MYLFVVFPCAVQVAPSVADARRRAEERRRRGLGSVMCRRAMLSLLQLANRLEMKSIETRAIHRILNLRHHLLLSNIFG